VLLDLDRPLTPDLLGGGNRFEIITREAPEALDTIRHDTAHVLAEAVQELFPGTQVTIGPNVEDGFYYDFARDEPFSLDDLAVIEKRMREIIDRDEKITPRGGRPRRGHRRLRGPGRKPTRPRSSVTCRPAIRSRSITRAKWKDLCRGPHLPSTKHVGKAFKLTKLAGAYWRGDQNNAQLQRIYGTAWASDADLAAYLLRIEEAEKRDHRKLGKTMDLFHIQEEGKGMVFWHPKGWTLYLALEAYMRRRLDAAGYREVKTPQILDKSLWERSGHAEKFGHAMFMCESAEGEILAVKPMNCPGHIQIFNVGQKSYRELPLRMAEFGACHRYEPSGAMHGIMRVRAFTQDDAHIFCREEQVTEESARFIELLRSVYSDLGMHLADTKFSTRPELRAGDDAVWDKAEAALSAAAEAAGETLVLQEGEGAFYGPKLEFSLKDAIGRVWQCGTLQLDFVLPERLDAEYVAEDGSKQRPVMLHRAILGSFERFIGILLENYAGHLPLWLAPVQVVVATITSDADEYAQRVADQLTSAGIRAEVDFRNEKINYKIREHSLAKVPVIAVVGRKEAENGEVALRRLGGEGQKVLSLEDALRVLTEEATPPDLARDRAAARPETLVQA
jgi:threonyl-tRNA synthetase